MSKIKKIKIYTHHKRYFETGAGVKTQAAKLGRKFSSAFFAIFYYAGLAVINIIKFFKNTLVSACFHTGSLIINSVAKTFNAAKNDALKTAETFPRRLKLLFRPQFNRAIVSFLAFALIGWGAIEGLNLVAKALDIKGKILRTAFVGDIYLNQAKDALGSQDLGQAGDRFELAYQTFSRGQKQIADSGQILNGLLSLVPQKQDADRLIEAASLVSQSGRDFIDLENSFKNLKITAAGITPSDKPTSETFGDINSSIASLEAKLSRANSNVNAVDINNLPASNRENFLNLKSKLNAGKMALDNFSQIFSLGRALLVGDKNLLLLFENNNELRATGGFMGTFGGLELKDGAITKINVSSIYDLDGQLTEVIQPPQPLLNLSDRWYLRDSNWFANFPDSAKKISSFYEREGGETPDLILAVTPNLIVDWLKITGPIYLPKYGVTLNSGNFVEQTQVSTTQSNDLPTNAPKQFLADLVPLLLQKISGLDKNAFPQIVQSLQNNLNSKQIVIYSRDAQTQTQLSAFHWSGELSDTDRDYVSVVSSNLGGTKTDLFVDQKINLTTSVAKDGTITNELDITRTNKMPQLDQTNNLSFIRVYVPQGSKLISDIGFDFKNLQYPSDINYKIDNDVYNWEKNAITENLTGTMIGQEAGKTFFGNWLNVDGGETKTVKLVYQLPFKINDVDRYSLLLQKQIGAQNQQLNWTLNFPNYQIAWENFSPDQLNTDNLNSAIILDKDYFLGMVLSKR